LFIPRQWCVTSKFGLTAVCQCRNMSSKSSPAAVLYTASALRHPSSSISSESIIRLDHRDRYCLLTYNTTGSLQLLFLLDCLHTSSVSHQRSSSHDLPNFSIWSWYVTTERPASLVASVKTIEFRLCGHVYKCLNGSGLASSLTVYSEWRLRSSSSSTLVVPVTRRATLHGWPCISSRGRPGMQRFTRLRHSSANRLIILHCDVLQNFSNRRDIFDFVTCSCSYTHVYLIVW